MNKIDTRFVARPLVTETGASARYNGISAVFRAIRVLTFALTTD